MALLPIDAQSEGWGKFVMPPISYTDAEKELRVRFVTEYLFDYNAYLACLRLGFNAGFAQDYAKRFMDEPYVRQLIKQAELDAENEKADGDNKRRIMAALFKEANYHGPGSSHSARVAALAKLTALYGMDAATKIESKVTTTTTQAVQFYLPENNR